ncbi:hypothetical protein Agub_g475 [Astrephomene gubernaculifera]|uniref:Protein kinase domain-containing protein n=1 Tax=Astrephomene gubernaculifera TaxID=47775 RepID=A0AAD3HGB4_9CHLO|nr:hypothetical protein Agub_g475 [Astrephomene gubernaculifera]
MQKDMVKADAFVDSQLEHRLAPLVAGQELASAVIQDTVKYLGIQPTAISQLNGPYLQVRPAGSDASDILLVGSWRTHYQPGGDAASGPVLDSMQRVMTKPAPVAQLHAAKSDGSQLQANTYAPARALVTQAGSLTAPGAAAALATDGLQAPQAAGDQGPGRYNGVGAMHHALEQIRSSEQRAGDGLQEGPYLGHQGLVFSTAMPPRSAGPIIEECPSDAEPSSPRKHGHQQHRQHQHENHAQQREQQHVNGEAVAGRLHGVLHAEPIVQLADSLSGPDRVVEDAAALPQQQRLQEVEEELRQQQLRSAEHHSHALRGAASPADGHVVRLQGPGMVAASAFASAAAAAAAYSGGAAASPPASASHGVAGLSNALVPSVANPLLLSPRPRSEWELDPNKIVMGRRLAVGGFGEVFMAKYEGTLVAVKRLLATDSDTTKRFVDEVHMLASLRHPNLLLFMGYTLTPEPSIVTEFMARGSLFRILRQAGNRPPDARFQRAVAVSVARGMAYLHSRRPPILHLDLKSPNVLVDDRWRVKIADFGLSRVRQRTYVSSGATSGSPEWMAPEVLRCDQYAEAADVYSYGVVLWELLTGQAPWADLNAMQVVGAVGFARRTLPDPSEGDQLLLHLCKACRAHDPTQRPSFAQIVEAMDSHFGPPAFPGPQQQGEPAAAVATVGPVAEAGNQLPPPPPQQQQPEQPQLHQQQLPLPQLPAPEGAVVDVEQVAPAAAAADGAGGDRAAAAAAGGAERPSTSEPSAGTAAAAGARHSRITRHHSLADVMGPEPDGSAAAAAGNLSGGGGAPARLDARFMSVHDSPRSRRRYRSPRGQDMVGPPAVTARLQDGRKTPSPRTIGGRRWRGGAFSDDEYELAHGSPPPPPPQLEAAEATAANPAGTALHGATAALAATGIRGSQVPAISSPFAAMATSRFGPGSSTDVRRFSLSVMRSAEGGEGGALDGGGLPGGGADGAGEGPQAMELGSPDKHSALAAGAVEQAPIQQSQSPRSQAQEKRRLDQLYTASAVAAPQPSPQWGQEELASREERQQPLQQPEQPEDAQQQQTGQATQQQAAELLHPAVHGDGTTAPVVQSRPGHRRVSSDEAGRLHRLQAAAVARVAGGGSAGGAPTGPALPPQHQQQQRLLGSVAPSGAGLLPPLARRSRGLGRHSAPMRYTYGGTPSASAGIPQQQQQGYPSQQHQQQQLLLQLPARTRQHHGHSLQGHPAHPAQQHVQQLMAAGNEALGLLQQYEQQQQQRFGGSHSAPSIPATGGNDGDATAAAALGAPVSLSPLGAAAEGEGAMQRMMSASAMTAEALLSGGDPWPDTHSELSFAFILREDNASVCSDDYPQLPLLEEDETADRMAMDDQDTPVGSLGAAPFLSAAPFLAAAPAALLQLARRHRDDDADFELPRPFLAAEPRTQQHHRPQHAVAAAAAGAAAPAPAPTSSPFAALASAASWGLAAAGSGGAGGDGDARAAPQADLWAALQQAGSSGSRMRGTEGVPPLGFSPRSGSSVSAQQLRPQPPPPQESLAQRPAEHQAQQQQVAAKPRGGLTTYRSGRFKVTIEPAGADGMPPPPSPQQQQQQAPQPQLVPSLALPEQQQEQALHAQSATPHASASPSNAAAGQAPEPGSDAPHRPPLHSSPSHDGTAGELGPLASAVAAVNGTNGAPLSPTSSAAHLLATSVSEAPGTVSRPRSSLHGHGELSAGGPPVALNGVTMYRKGRFFVSSHAAAGVHSLSVTNPLATSSQATGSGGGSGGSGAASPSESVHGESDEHDAAGGASGPASPLTADNPHGNVQAYRISHMQGSQNGSGSGSGGSATGSEAGSPTEAAGKPPCGPRLPQQQQQPPSAQTASAKLARQYSRGRFTVAESIVAAPAPESRRPSSGSGAGDMISGAGPGIVEATDAAAAGAAAVTASTPLPPVSHPPLWPSAPTATAAAAWTHGSVCAEHNYAAPLASVPLTMRNRSSSSPGLHAQQSRMMPPPGLQLPSCASAGALPISRASAPGMEGYCGAGIPSPRTEQVVVRKVGRFTVREVEPVAGGGSNASSRNPSSSGAQLDALASAGMAAAAPAEGAALQGRSAQPDDALVLASLYSSGSLASGSGCSRASSGGPGSDAMDLVHMGPQPPHAPRTQQGLHRQMLHPQPPPEQQQQLAAVAAAGAAQPKVLCVKSRGRFKVIEHEALPPPAPPQAPVASQEDAVLQPPQPQIAGGSLPCELQEAGSLRPPRPPATQRCTSPSCPISQQAGAPALEGSHVAVTPYQACTEPAHVQQASSSMPVSAQAPPPSQSHHVPQQTQQFEAGLVDAYAPLVHGGVLHPPPVLPPTSASGASAAAAAKPAAPVAAPQAPWGGSRPQAPEQAAELHADMARMVRERMERNAQGCQQAQEQQRSRQHQQREMHARGRRAQERPGGGLQGEGAERRGRGAALDNEGEEEEDEGPEERCTYELSFGAGLTIQISHDLHGARGGRGGEEEGEDELMVDVGIVEEADGEDEGGEEEEGRGGEQGEDEAAEGDVEDWEEQQPLQPPETPAHEPLHEREGSWADTAQRMLRRRRRWRRRLGGYGEDSDDSDDGLEEGRDGSEDEDSMEMQ